MANIDRIEKSVVLHAPLDRVWRAIADATEFGRWFGVRVDGPFVAGSVVNAEMTGTLIDEAVAAEQCAHPHGPFPLQIVSVQPRRQLAFRWNPLPGTEFAELFTLVEFTLSETADGVRLTVVESGFDALPAGPRRSAWTDNDRGWTIQLDLVGRYVTDPAWA